MSSTLATKSKKAPTYQPPKSGLRRFLWQRRMWAETTFGLTMMEPWEKTLVWTITILLATLFFTGLFKYLPHHLHFIQQRAVYYFSGQE